MFFFFNDTATTEIYTLSLHDALPIWPRRPTARNRGRLPPLAGGAVARFLCAAAQRKDRKSTRLNSSHGYISYAVFCLKKKKTYKQRGGTSTLPISPVESGYSCDRTYH